MQRIFHECRSAGRTFMDEQWSDYCTQSRHDDSKRLTTQIGKYLFNDCDICLNPDVMSLVVEGKSYGYYVTIKWCDCGNGFWSSAIDYGYGDGGGGSGVSYADRMVGEKYNQYGGYRTEMDAKVAACDKALEAFTHSIHGDPKKLKRLVAMVEDYRRKIKPKYVQLELF